MRVHRYVTVFASYDALKVVGGGFMLVYDA